ncbi:MAG TPA: phage portal protein [Terriglobales bacterium]|nr:phage portal protein [Terriglobales bacterium]
MGALHRIQAEYSASLPSRFRRTRTRLGGSADAHYVQGDYYWRMVEYARDMDRNDAVVGQMIDRAVLNMVRSGLTLVPRTGEKALDEEIKGRHAEWATDPTRCDATGRFTFPEMEALVKRHELIDGDHFAILLDGAERSAGGNSGTLIQLVEGDRVDSAQSFGGEVVLGVRVDAVGRPIEYWFPKDRVKGERLTHGRRTPAGPEAYDKRPAFDQEGWPVVLHVYSPSRVSQTRGVTVFHAISDLSGMLEDVNFAKVVQQQIVSCVAVFLEQTADSPWGSRDTEEQADGTVATLEELAPGLVHRLRPGEKISGFSPNVPNAEYFDHVKLLLRLIGASVGMPLTLVLLDTSNTTFHGYRGEMAQAKLGFELGQVRLGARFHRPVHRNNIRLWLPSLGEAARKLGDRVYRHEWRGRGFPYVDPKVDAEADKILLDNLLKSPRDLLAERGEDWEETYTEAVEDRANMIRAAMAAAKALSTDDNKVTWREVANLSTPQGMQANVSPPPEKEKPAPAGTAAEGSADVARIDKLEGMIEGFMARGAANGAPATAPAAQPGPAPLQMSIAQATFALPEGTAATMHAQMAEQKAPVIEKVILQIAEGAVQNTNNFAPQNVLEQTIAVSPTPITVEAKAGEMKIEAEVVAKVEMPPARSRTGTVKEAADGSYKISLGPG